MIAISKSLMSRISRDFSHLSAICPAVAEKQHERRDEDGAGEVHQRVRVERRVAAAVAPKATKMTSAFLRTLSFAAPGELRPEERREAALAHQVELVGLVHVGRTKGGAAK